jgi:hypothetical protein
MRNNSHIVVQWTILTDDGAFVDQTDFEAYEVGEGFEFIIDMGEDGFAHVVLSRDKTRTLIQGLLLRLGNGGRSL